MTKDYGNIRTADYTYDLPQERIAKYPLPERDSSRLLVWDGGSISDRHFRELPMLADRDAMMVFNNTRVIRARLIFRKESGALIEVFCLEPHLPAEFQSNLASGGPVEWKCLIGNLKRWKHGRLESRFVHSGKEYLLTAERSGPDGDSFIVRFAWNDVQLSFADVLESIGHMPIPPYLGRDDEESDRSTYQTTYARISGSVAAPTAGLHFTPAVMEALQRNGIDHAEVTLHVSAGTFRPVKTELIGDHMMHSEHFYVSREVLQRLRDRKITAVGTTAVRTIESLYWLGLSSAEGRWPATGTPSVAQWEPYERDAETDPAVAIDSLLSVMQQQGLDILEARTDIIIVPGYRFRIVNNMLTNFHQPDSTLLLLVAAFTGEAWRDIYAHALSSGYRFLSYGDSMLLRPGGIKDI
ncbi:MAG: S-adenosylmethionine:tRNA ribosyltransferase-isomerase [Bacteroidales bacterium]|jgi:S-adenosylmethionine:tRNA ribosyltransferase-isomerase|nr:S-adenosylmethionine:tRNA ribosyltransferase-isomerase [Bacteroidales bacterium]